jgi:hypothetical protein
VEHDGDDHELTARTFVRDGEGSWTLRNGAGRTTTGELVPCEACTTLIVEGTALEHAAICSGGTSATIGAAAEAERWNANHPVGTPVRYWPWTREGEGIVSCTRSRAAVMCDHASVWVEGRAGSIALSHVEVETGAERAADYVERRVAEITRARVSADTQLSESPGAGSMSAPEVEALGRVVASELRSCTHLRAP